MANKPLPKCEGCGATGILYPVDGKSLCLKCSLELSGHSERKNGMPPDLSKASFSNFRTDFSKEIAQGVLKPSDQSRARASLDKAQKIVRIISAGGQIGAVFYGENGLGKSHLVAGVVNAIGRVGKTSRWINGEFYYSRMLDLHRNGESIENEIYEFDEDLLVIDDCSFASDTEFFKRIITMLVTHVIDYLHASVIITTNKTPNGLQDLVGSAVVDRIATFGLNQEFRGHSMRRVKNRESVWQSNS